MRATAAEVGAALTDGTLRLPSEQERAACQIGRSSVSLHGQGFPFGPPHDRLAAARPPCTTFSPEASPHAPSKPGPPRTSSINYQQLANSSTRTFVPVRRPAGARDEVRGRVVGDADELATGDDARGGGDGRDESKPHIRRHIARRECIAGRQRPEGGGQPPGRRTHPSAFATSTTRRRAALIDVALAFDYWRGDRLRPGSAGGRVADVALRDLRLARLVKTVAGVAHAAGSRTGETSAHPSPAGEDSR